MKKIYIMLLMIVVLLLGCSSNIETGDETFDIVTSFYPIYIATANIIDGAQNVTLNNLTSTSVGCLHDYQLTTADLMLVEKSDVLIINGGGMESFIQKVIDSCKNTKIINSGKSILKDENEHDENSHIWVSISLYEKQVKNICDELIKINPKNAEIYNNNTNKYLAKLDELKNEMHMALDILDDDNKNIVTFHEAFEYFAKEFNLNVVDVIEREPGTYPSAGELADIISTINKTNAKAIFVEPQYSKTAADTISKETNVPVYTLNPVVSGELKNDAYEKIMRENLKNLVEALGD